MVKYLLQTSIRKFHNYVKTEIYVGLAYIWKNKILLVSDTTLRCLIPRQVRKFTPTYKQMCGCETYIHSKQLQHTLKSWRRRHACNKIVTQIFFLMVIYYMIRQEIQLIQLFVQNNLILVRLT